MLLELDNLTIGYRTQAGILKAVEGVSLSLDQGKTLGLVGESGCGKTTLGMSIMGLLPANGSILGGKIRYRGEDLRDYSPEKMRGVRWQEIAMVFQASMNALNPVHHVEDQIAEAILSHSPDTTGTAALAMVHDLLRLVDIPIHRARDYPHQYSGGMKQRAVIAMALACKPKLIIADEPTTALDVIVQHQILEEIKTLQAKLGISILLISHDISIVEDMCDHTGIMYAGELVEYGTTPEVFGDPLHPYTKALLDSFPTLTGSGKELAHIPGTAPSLMALPKGCRFHDRCPIGERACTMSRPEWTEASESHKARCFKCPEGEA